ncbi:protein kinase C and casein kinase substrate in neurons protein 3-like [Clarias gariepinus]|uniref:protein kinase C and casein kinase substrate in neurons protein 3-like n=1 Tax=Clarias gariepinus TaxID=13013 RepID=UPI00234E25F1|nr:protein kinase C and casein kinase substrate in neurons protein 3-like [Clarias gariepinus]
MAEKKDENILSFWMPGNYAATVHRTKDSYQVCDVIVDCFKDRARVEKLYAQQLTEWSNKWKKISDSRPMYGSLLRAWQCFFSSTERLSALHTSISQSLVLEDGQHIRSWQKEAFQKKLFGGFRESYNLKREFAHAQRPWLKKLKKLQKAQRAYNKSCQKEQNVLNKESRAKNKINQNEQTLVKIQQAKKTAGQDRDQAREHYVKVLDDLIGYTPRYMEDMESVFDQSQEQERKRISFLKNTLLSIHTHLDITNNQSVKAVYSDLLHTLTSINEQDDLHWWKNNHGPGMSTNWPTMQEWAPPCKKQKYIRKPRPQIEEGVMIGGVHVRALYTYTGENEDELSFKAGEEFLKVEDEDDQGWCRGVKEGGVEGYYPANYVLPVE